MNVIDNVINLAEERGVKQSFLNELIGGYRGKMTDFKKGKTTLTNEELNIIAEYFKVTSDYLLGLSEYKNADENWLSTDKNKQENKRENRKLKKRIEIDTNKEEETIKILQETAGEESVIVLHYTEIDMIIKWLREAKEELQFSAIEKNGTKLTI